jgi:hypothetical protein
MKRAVQALSVAAVLALLVIAPASAQVSEPNYIVEVATPASSASTSAVQVDQSGAPGGVTKVGIKPIGVLFPPLTLDPKAAWKDQWLCRSAGPAEVTGFQVVCTNATFLDFHIADCCLPGDHWQLKGKAWDVNPNTGVTTAPGPANVFGVAGRIYNYGGTGFNPGGLNAYVECSYLNGVNVFLADSFVVFSSDGLCAVAADPVVRRIDRAP